MMQSCASAAKLRGGGPILNRGSKTIVHIGLPPPRSVNCSLASRRDRAAELQQCLGNRYAAGRRSRPAGISPVVGGPRRIEPSVWRRVMEVNLTGAFLGARAATRVMGDGGRLIFTGSVLGDRPRRGLTAYSASKAGLIGMAKGLALDLAPAGITVNVVSPGWFDSPLADGWKSDPELAAAITGHTAQERWGAPRDLAGVYQFLASDASAFITGTVINVDGGYLLV